LVELGFQLLNIAKDPSLTIKEKNIKISNESILIMHEMNKLGFPLKSFKMIPSRLFNPGVHRDLLFGSPHDYIQSPAYVLEDSESFSMRIKLAFRELFNDNPDIVCIQELETGRVDDVDFDEINYEVMSNYPNYEFIKSPLKESEHTIFTCYCKDKFNFLTSCSKLKETFKCFSDTNHKIQFSLLENILTGKVYTIGNLHADYSKSNTKEPWHIMRNTFDIIPDLIICGDFNLKPINESYFSETMYNNHFGGKYKLLLTPEPPNIGNPTFDMIISKTY